VGISRTSVLHNVNVHRMRFVVLVVDAAMCMLVHNQALILILSPSSSACNPLRSPKLDR